MTRRLALAAALGALFSACSLPIPKVNDPIIATTYDLGPPRAYQASNPAIPGTLSVPDVSGAEWLDQGIVYRLLYEDRAQPQVYTRSRWSADPASLLTERIRSRFAPVAKGVVSPLDSAKSDYTLRIELRDFSQSFESAAKSAAILRARATLIASADRTVLAQREFDVRRDAAPSAEGGVKALSEATDAFLEELVKWTVGSAKPTTKEKP
jgi:cholesterol transport system auxiliary component